MFYDRYITWMILPLYNEKASSRLKMKMCTFLGHCVAWHGYRMRYILPQHPIIWTTVLGLLKMSDSEQSLGRNGRWHEVQRTSFLLVAAVRFLEDCVCQVPRKVSSGRDTAYHRQLLSNNMLAPVLQKLEDLGERDNLVFSAIFSF